MAVLHAFIALSRLTLFEHECWDVSHVRGTMDLSNVLAQLIERFEQAGSGFDDDPVMMLRDDLFSRLARKIRKVKCQIDGRNAEELTQEAAEIRSGGFEEVDGELRMGLQSDLSDEAFWLDVMSQLEPLI